MSSRRNGSVSRAAEAASKNRLHMDRNPQHSRITDPSNPAGRRKEIDNVMKRARQASPGSWDRKLLEVEEKDPNRWRHTGYKQMYLESSGSVSPRRSRSPVLARRLSRSPLGRRSRSPVGRRSRSPVARRKSRSPRRTPRRSPRRSPVRPSPLPLAARRRSPRPRSPVRRASPPPRRASPPARRASPPARRASPPARRASPPARRASPRAPRPRPVPPVRVRPPSPPGPRMSSSSSGSSCSDESCSVCSAKNKKGPPPPPPKGAKPPPRATSKSPSRARPAATAGAARAVQPTRELLKAREGSKRSREEKVLEWQRSQLAVRPGGAAAAPAPAPVPIPGVHIKREGERHPPTDPRRRPRVSPAAINAALNDSESDSESEASSERQPQRLTLSERFGKMAQWSADRSARLENMRITRRETTLHVRIERDPAAGAEPGTTYPGVEPVAPVGSYPEELLSAPPGGLPSWDDVTVRYEYYKKRGYLRGLTLGDYVKWEEWWYKYQEWLERERAYERWAEGEPRPARRDRRRKGGRHRGS